ncbi:MAG: MBL fold metallo-hydrolase [Verrucomicrobiota bacterium]|jgi:phosphoribosyl 1,2-cyclic phosphodiesterase
MAAFVKFWGTRGAIPTPASWTRVYGGNTSCVEVRFDQTVFVCDAGSGIRELGKDLLTRQPPPKELHLLITHTHWDHIQGFPFFAPVYLKTMPIHVYGRQTNDNSTYQLLSGQMSSDYFPVSFKEVGATIAADYFENGQREIDGVRVRSFALNHPGGCHGFSFEKDGRKIVYATDNELEIEPGDLFPDLEDAGPPRRVPAALVEVAQDADLLIMDAQYDEKEYATKIKWGHSCCFSVTDLATRAKVKTLALFHHDPESTDRAIDQMVQACRQRAARHGAPGVICAAREGVEFKF